MQQKSVEEDDLDTSVLQHPPFCKIASLALLVILNILFERELIPELDCLIIVLHFKLTVKKFTVKFEIERP